MTRLDIPDLAQKVRGGERASLARAITLVESSRREDQKPARQLLEGLLPDTGKVIRVGISGAPGVGKSTLIETLGLHLLERGHRPAVLAVDPSSTVSGGSILGDKSRMDRLAQQKDAFIRPSPSASTLGGVARRTREVMLLCEAAGYDVVLIETVGVGQSEVEVAEMVDFFLLMLLAGSGDELQGIKKGILEHADAWVVNKADGDNLAAAQATLAEYQAALAYTPTEGGWKPRAMAISALTGDRVADLWQTVVEYIQLASESGHLQEHRGTQKIHWVERMAREQLLDRFSNHPEVTALRAQLNRQVETGKTSPWRAAEALVVHLLEGGSE